MPVGWRSNALWPYWHPRWRTCAAAKPTQPLQQETPLLVPRFWFQVGLVVRNRAVQDAVRVDVDNNTTLLIVVDFHQVATFDISTRAEQQCSVEVAPYTVDANERLSLTNVPKHGHIILIRELDRHERILPSTLPAQRSHRHPRNTVPFWSTTGPFRDVF